MPVPEKPRDTVPTQVFREVMGHLASGVTIITAAQQAAPVGMTATAVCSVSAKPPMLLVSLTAGSRTALGVEQSKAFAVHMPSSLPLRAIILRVFPIAAMSKLAFLFCRMSSVTFCAWSSTPSI